MPTTRKTHQECKPYVCFLCLRKNVDGRVLTENFKKLIFENVYRNFRGDENYLPSGVCSGCERILRSLPTENPRKIPGKIIFELLSKISFYLLEVIMKI